MTFFGIPHFKCEGALWGNRKTSFFRSPRLYVFGHCDLVFRPTEMLRTILELTDQAKKIFFYGWGPQRPSSHLKNAICRKSSFFQSPRIYVFGHIDLVFRPTEMLRTILELADQVEKFIFLWLGSIEGFFTLLKCDMSKKFIFSVSSDIRFRFL